MNKLGIYFGSKVISIAEVKGRQVLNNIQIPLPALASNATGIVLPEKAKIAALVKAELINRHIETKEVAVTLSGKDVIVRNFEMALLPRDELANAVNFEVRKYIPFKTEELISDFQYKLDKAAQKNRILFVAIKKETLDRYLSIADELGLTMTSLEYSAFSILKLLKLGNTGTNKGIRGIFSVDLVENDEINFLVLEDGFPLFSRDAVLMGGGETVSEIPKTEKFDPASALERLKREIRISMDYYDRTLPLKSMDRIFFVMDHNYQTELEGFINFIRDIGLASQFIDLKKCLGKPVPFSLAFLKSYAAALPSTLSSLKPDLLAARQNTLMEAVIAKQPKTKLSALLLHLKSEYAKAAIVGIFVCIVVYYFGITRIVPLEKEINNIIQARPQAATVKLDANYEDLVNTNTDYKKRITALDDLLKKKIYFTELLDAIPRVTPKTIRFTELTLIGEGGRIDLVLKGIVYLRDTKQGMDVVNKFLAELKSNTVFAKYFKEINVVSINQEQMFGRAVTTFVISCRK